MSKHKPQYYQRWNVQHRLQHGVLVISMIGLLVTGLAIKYHYWGWAQWVFSLTGGFRNNLAVHKASAVLLVFAAVWHLAYLLWHWAKKGATWEMVPTLKDIRDAADHVLYLLQIRKTPPQYGRYTYLEKFEYLAIFWGMVVMGVTGFALWFPTIAANWVPRWWLDAFRIVHTNEALVALISLAYGHFFTVHFHPAVFPSSPVWYNGKISLEHMMEEHPLEYQQLVAKGELPAMAAGAEHGHGLSPWRKALAGVELIIYSAIFYYLLITFLPKLLA